MKTGDMVIYTERGSSFLATVLEARELEHHSGENGEPLLHLGFFAPAHEYGPNGKDLKRISLVGTLRQDQLAQFRLDVAHESHSFPAHLKLPVYPGGRWRGPVLEEEDIKNIGTQPVAIASPPEDPALESKTSESEPPTVN